MMTMFASWAIEHIIRKIRWFAIAAWYSLTLVFVPAVLVGLATIKASFIAASEYLRLPQLYAEFIAERLDLMRPNQLSTPETPGLSSFFDGIGFPLFFSFSQKIALAQLAFIVLAVIAYKYDRRRDERSFDHFRGAGLFFRFGEQIRRSVVPVPIPAGVGGDKAAALAEKIRGALYDRVSIGIPQDKSKVDRDYSAKNRATGETKKFLRIASRTPQGSLIVHLLHFAPCGATVIMHDFTYARGMIPLRNKLRFFLESPYLSWLWVFSWARNRFSITSSLSDFSSDEFDLMDLQTLYSMNIEILSREVLRVLEAQGVLTPELRQIIVNNFTHAKNINIGGAQSQFMSISADRGSQVSDVSLAGR